MAMGWSIKYHELFSISMEQPYYQNKICRQYTVQPVTDFRIVPSAETRALLKRFDLLYKNVDGIGGGIVLGRTNGLSGSNPLLQFKPGTGKTLTFFIELDNPAVVNFNDIPALFSGEVFYFSNNIIDAAAPRDNLHLSKDTAGVKKEDVIRITSVTYTYQKSSPITPGTAKVKHMATGRELLPQSFVTEGGKTTLTFNLSSMPSGKCELLEGGVLLEAFYYPGANVSSQFFGVIELSLNSVLNANYRIIEADGSLTPQRPAYKITLSPRATAWRYTLLLQSSSPLYLELQSLSPADQADFLNRLNVVSNDSAITFTRSTVSEKEFQFVSDNPVLLQEKYFSTGGTGTDTLDLSLKKYLGDIKEAVVKASLPYPGGGVIDTSNDPIIYSDILLTL